MPLQIILVQSGGRVHAHVSCRAAARPAGLRSIERGIVTPEITGKDTD